MNRIAFFSARAYERPFFDRALQESPADGTPGTEPFELHYFETTLNDRTAGLARDHQVVCAFVNDHLDRPTLLVLKECGVRLIAMRCAGYNNVDLPAAKELGIPVVRVPAYSPHAVAEHTLALLLTLARKTHKAYARVRDGNFSLDGLMGFDVIGKTIGVVGTGRIGGIFAQIMRSLGCEVLAFDVYRDANLVAKGVRYVDLPELFADSDIISLHAPLTPASHHLINGESLNTMKKGVMILNTSRGALLDTRAVIAGLKAGRIGALGLDVYEQEEGIFFEDLSGQILQDDTIARLLTFPNVIITAHQAFFTDTAMTEIARTTMGNIREWDAGRPLTNEIVLR